MKGQDLETNRECKGFQDASPKSLLGSILLEMVGSLENVLRVESALRTTLTYRSWTYIVQNISR